MEHTMQSGTKLTHGVLTLSHLAKLTMKYPHIVRVTNLFAFVMPPNGWLAMVQVEKRFTKSNSAFH